MTENPREHKVNRFDPTDTPESDPVPTGEDVVNRQKGGRETPRRYDVPEQPHNRRDDANRE